MSRTFLVTGASKGIGLALAHRLARDGHHVIGLARRPAEGFPGTFVTVDLGDAASTAATLADLVGRFAIDSVVNNVGLVRPQRLGAVDLGTLDEVLRVSTCIRRSRPCRPPCRACGRVAGGGSSTCPA